MANLTETAIWEVGVYQWETSDPVQGGPNGIDNKPTRQLANRTLWLKTELAKAVASIGKNKTDAENMFARKTTAVTAGAGLTGGGTLNGNVQFALGTPGTCSGNTTNWAGSDTHTHQLAAASPTVAGVAKLINNLTTDDADSALSAEMGKKLQDEKLGKEGNQEISGSTFTVGNRSYPGYRLWSTSGNEGFLIESSGSSNGHKLIIRRHTNGNFESSNIRSFALPNINGDYTLAPAGLLTNQDLNTLTVPGLYGQNSNSNAQTARNYPVTKAGSLLVLPSAYGVQQIYSVFDSTDIYARNQNSGGWTVWQKTNVSPTEMQAAIAAAQPEKSDAVDLDDSTKLATSKAVKTLNDKIATAVPSGTVAYFAGQNPPAGWLKANGAAVSRTTYADLFAAIGTTYGAGDGRTTFNLPDLRGEFVRGWDDGRNIDRGRALGSSQSDNIAEHRHATGWRAGSRGNEFVLLRSAWSGQSNITADVVAKGGAQIPGHDEHYVHVSGRTYTNSNDTYATSSAYYDTDGETRPRNIALLACIKI